MIAASCNLWLPRVMDLRFPVLCLLIAAEISMGLRDVRVTIPTAVKKGENANLVCNYDLEGDTLYSIKWYKGRREFYRYTPKENPAMKTFAGNGITVERSMSNESHVVLTSVEPIVSGKFSCEVSADAPSFHTMIVSGDMEIVEIPEQKPLLSGIISRYRTGDILRGNCSSNSSKPAANLTVTINDVVANPLQLINYKAEKNLTTNLETAIIGLSFEVTHQHFIRGKLKLSCTARIHEIYWQTTDKFIEEDRPRILATGASGHNMNLFSPYDPASSMQDASDSSDQDQELHLTHYKGGDVPSSSPPTMLRVEFTNRRIIAILLIVTTSAGLALIQNAMLPQLVAVTATAVTRTFGSS